MLIQNTGYIEVCTALELNEEWFISGSDDDSSQYDATSQNES